MFLSPWNVESPQCRISTILSKHTCGGNQGSIWRRNANGHILSFWAKQTIEFRSVVWSNLEIFLFKDKDNYEAYSTRHMSSHILLVTRVYFFFLAPKYHNRVLKHTPKCSMNYQALQSYEWKILPRCSSSFSFWRRRGN